MTEGHFIGTARSSALLYGKGVFTTVAVFDGSPFLWEKHWTRLVDSATRIELDISAYDEKYVLASLNDAIERDGIANGRARITFTDESESPMWSDHGEKTTALSIVAGKLRPVANELRLAVSPHLINSTSPLAGIKSCNYLENILSMNEAKGRGFHEAIRMNERAEITSGCMANVFWMKDGKLFTPALSTGCLAGTTREHVIENTECEEVLAKIDALKNSEAIFLTSAGLGITAVAEFEGRKIDPSEFPVPNLWPHP